MPQHNLVNGFKKTSGVLYYKFLVCIAALPQFLILTSLAFYVIFCLVTELFCLASDWSQWGPDITDSLFPEDSHVFLVLGGSFKFCSGVYSQIIYGIELPGVHCLWESNLWIVHK